MPPSSPSPRPSPNSAGRRTQFDPAVLDALSNFVIRLEWPPQRSTANANTDNAERVGDRA
jgi:hypothetical protein